MELKELRDEIDKIDDEMAKLFEQRAKIACEVAEYKRQHNIAIFQGGREEEVIKRAEELVAPDLAEGVGLFFTTLMDISKCRQQQLLTGIKPFVITPETKFPTVGAVTKGSYTADACEKFCGKRCRVVYYRDFAEVFEAVEKGDIDYGVLPIENSTAGEVGATYGLMLKHDFYICRSTKIRINHVLAAKKGVKLSDIKVVTAAVTIYIKALKVSTRIVFLYILPLISWLVMELIIRHGTVIPITRLIKCFTDSSGSTLSLLAIKPTPI